MISQKDFQSAERFAESSGGGLVLIVALIIIVVSCACCFCLCHCRRIKDDESKAYAYYLDMLRSGEMSNILVTEEATGPAKKQKKYFLNMLKSGQMPNPLISGQFSRAARRRATITIENQNQNNGGDIEAPPRRQSRIVEDMGSFSPIATEVVVLGPASGYATPSSSSLSNRRSSRISSPVRTIDDNAAVEVMAELTALEAAMEESKEDYMLQSALKHSQTAQEERRLREIEEESKCQYAEETAIAESEDTLVDNAMQQSNMETEEVNATSRATEDSILVNNPMRPSHLVERMMDEMGERAAARSLTPTSSFDANPDAAKRRYRVFQQGGVSDRILVSRPSRRRGSASDGEQARSERPMRADSRPRVLSDVEQDTNRERRSHAARRAPPRDRGDTYSH